MVQPIAYPIAGRTMSTLSLKVRFRLVLFFLIGSLTFSTYSFANQDNTRSNIYPLGEVTTSDNPVPDKVKKNQSKKVSISIRFDMKDDSEAGAIAYGTGFLVSRGILITNRHVLMTPVLQFEEKGSAYHFDEDGIPVSDNYTYSISAIVYSRNEKAEIPLRIYKVPKSSSFLDLMLLKVDLSFFPSMKLNERFPELFLDLLDFSEKLEVGEKVYVSGIAPMYYPILLKKGSVGSLLIDVIDYTFETIVSAPLPLNEFGVSTAYRLRGNAEHGFSGGFVLNSRGEVVGILFGGSINFLHIISSKDILKFIKD